MSSPVAAAPRVTDSTARLHAELDRLAGSAAELCGGSGHAAVLDSLTRAEARIAALKLRVIAAADRACVPAREGAASTGQWAARVARSDQAEAHREVGLAQGLERRTAVRAALADGAISAEHAAVIVRADRDLPSHLTAVQREQVEAALVAKAAVMAPGALRRAARRALEAVEADDAVVDAQENAVVRNEEEQARSRVRFSLHDNADGTVSGNFTVPGMHGQLLRKILQTITAPRRGRLGVAEAQVGPRESRTDWDRARGEAFLELIEHLPTGHLHPRTAATLVVTVEESTLREALKVAQLDTGAALSAGEVRRLACNASLLPAVLGGASVPLDLGRSARVFSDAQRTALGLVHKTCAADGCDRPFSWCELHHLVAWALGGRTDLDQAIPLCHFHHQRIHDDAYAWVRGRDGSISFRQRT